MDIPQHEVPGPGSRVPVYNPGNPSSHLLMSVNLKQLELQNSGELQKSEI